jgi:hypothetical protein
MSLLSFQNGHESTAATVGAVYDRAFLCLLAVLWSRARSLLRSLCRTVLDEIFNNLAGLFLVARRDEHLYTTRNEDG